MSKIKSTIKKLLPKSVFLLLKLLLRSKNTSKQTIPFHEEIEHIKEEKNQDRERVLRAKKVGLTKTQLNNFLADPEGAKKLDRLLVFGATKKVAFLNESKNFIVESIFDDAYQLEKIKLPRDKNISIVDIGANVGTFAIAARQEFPLSTIHCYEPNPLLEKYMRLNSYAAGGKYFMEGVGKEGSFSFDNKQNEVLDSKSVAIVDFKKQGKIKIVNLKTVLERLHNKIDLLKIDCEGSEWVILQDFESLQKVKYITLEYHRLAPDNSFDFYDRSIDIQAKALDLLKNAGFKIEYIKTNSPDAGMIVGYR